MTAASFPNHASFTPAGLSEEYPLPEITMTTALDRILTWAPRVLTVGVAAFLSVIALDVFSEGRPMTWAFFALAMHLIPSALVLLIVIIAWKFEWLGAVAAGALALLYGENLPWTTSLIITGPLTVVAALYAANALRHRHPTAPA
jgi:hypothetical protein